MARMCASLNVRERRTAVAGGAEGDALRDIFDVRCARVVSVEQQIHVHEQTFRSGLTGARIDRHMNHGLARSAGLRCSSERMKSAIERGCTT